MGDFNCNFDTRYYDFGPILGEFPGFHSTFLGAPKWISVGDEPFDGKIAFVHCEAFENSDGQMSERCIIDTIKADKFKEASSFISKYFPGEQNEISRPEITGEYPDNCETPERRLVHYSMAIVLNGVANLSRRFPKPQRAILERHRIVIKGEEEEQRHSRIDISKMNRDELEQLRNMVIAIRDNPPEGYTKNHVKAYSIAADEIGRIIEKKE